MKIELLIPIAFFTILGHGQVKIGENPTSIGANSVLELESPNKALIVPRVVNYSDIVNPVNGMIIYVISENKFKIYQNSSWVNFFT